MEEIVYICIGDKVPEGVVSYADIIKGGDPGDILVDVHKDDPAELMFTSGTTGPPKPVCHSHDTLYQIGIGMPLLTAKGMIPYTWAAPFLITAVVSFCPSLLFGGGKIII